MISTQENLEYIKDQPDFSDFDDPDELIAHICGAWVDDPNMGPRDWWTSAVLLVSFGEGMGNKTGLQYGGVVPMVGGPDDQFGLNSWDSFEHLRALSAARDGRPWTTLILTYRDDTAEFAHEFIYGGDRADLDVTGFKPLDKDTVRALRPTRGTPLEVPVTARAAWSVATDYSQLSNTPHLILKDGEYSVDRLDGGWRVYATGTPDQPEHLAGIGDARDHAVALVNDSAEVTITTSEVDAHQAELDALPTHDTTWD